MATTDDQMRQHLADKNGEAIAARNDAVNRLKLLQGYLASKTDYTSGAKTSKRGDIIHSGCSLCTAWAG